MQISNHRTSRSCSCHSWHEQKIYRASVVLKLFLCGHVKGRRDLSPEHSMRIMMSVGYGAGPARGQARKR